MIESRRDGTPVGFSFACDRRLTIGRKNLKGGGMSEAEEQRAVVEWCDLRKVPVFHIPNGGFRNGREAANLKRQGVRAGVPDLCVPVARGGFHSLYIEMKAAGGRVSEKQAEWLKLLRDQGMCAYVCYGAGNAVELIERYMDGRITA